jgi:hypothetical protein
MRRFLLLLMVLASFSFANDAMPDMLEARAEYVACDVDYADEWLEMREDCGDEANVSVFDSSDYIADMKEDLESLRDNAKDGDRFSFGLDMFQLAGHSLKLIGEVVKDAFDHKNLAFFSCVRDGEPELKDERESCREDAINLEKEAAKDYVQNELDDAEELIDTYDAIGIDTDEMEAVVEDGEDLMDEVDDGYGTYDPIEIRALHLKHSRLILLFRCEQMLAVIDYAEPIVEASNNDNKEEVLEKADDLKDDITAITSACEYDATVDDNADYAEENLECWDDAIDAFQDFNDLRALLLKGA